ncbi:acylneuraminate cytidylyltransferase family protein [Solemya pervernicosa gill symbiont]|uniref:acylneuraminate cytidylyltransferase family protein n=1 Tax=Solemya pervernicosa gill symbiont TaxID=642797 RepID=UPI0015616254|nr:acylneuraminate cytidylyltransferase family protein [Solemya pervernicosa gill symbiont]
MLALIPAKAGSTRLPRKNIMPLLGRSLLEWTVIAARDSGICDRLIVSTEDEAVVAEAKRLHVDVPFMRPAELARDPAGVVEVALHALEELELQGEQFDTLVILLPTSPFRTGEDIRAAMAMFSEKGTASLMSVTKPSESPLTAQIMEDGLLTPLLPEWLFRSGAKSGAEPPNVVNANGAVTILDVEQFKTAKEYYIYPLAAYEMPWDRGVDIDTESDFHYAEFLARTRFGLDEKADS